MEHFLRVYGYFGIILCTFIGAEEGVVMSGLLAADGYLSLPGVILASALGGCLGDQIYFYAAFRFGEPLLKRFSGIRNKYSTAQGLSNRYGSILVLASRFLAGIRIAVSMLCGIMRMPPLKYSALNLVSGILWASLYASLSYRFGRALLARIPQSRHIIVWIVLMLLLVAVVAVRIRAFVKKRQSSVQTQQKIKL